MGPFQRGALNFSAIVGLVSGLLRGKKRSIMEVDDNSKGEVSQLRFV